jgi:CRP-like cAMP-binding protein
VKIERAIFPRSGLISIVVGLNDGAEVEAAMIGPAGVLGGAAIFGAKQHISTAVAQLPGRAWSVSVRDLTEIASVSAEFRSSIVAQERYLLAQVQQTAACNARHSILQRLCAWLLRAQDEAGRDEFLMTQEMLARMLGMQRASVSMFASQLQEKGLVHYRRGRLQITDPNGLAAHACECRAAVQKQRERLFGGQLTLQEALTD